MRAGFVIAKSDAEIWGKEKKGKKKTDGEKHELERLFIK